MSTEENAVENVSQTFHVYSVNFPFNGSAFMDASSFNDARFPFFLI